jgi:hypothetical protein
VVFSDDGDYASKTVANMQQVDNSVVWVSKLLTSDNPTTVSGDTSGGVLVLAAFSKSSNCFFLRDDPPNDTRYGQILGASPTDCYAANSAAVGTWSPTW